MARFEVSLVDGTRELLRFLAAFLADGANYSSDPLQKYENPEQSATVSLNSKTYMKS